MKGFRETIQTILEKDPAAKNWREVLLCYPSIYVLLTHRVSHWLYRHGMPVFARWLMQIARFLTGIDIHPGAQIGRRLFIDHGTGVVIGETAVVGDDCQFFHEVTLGSTGKHQGKRHPTIGNGVIIGAGAKILGNITIGNNVRIGANAVVLRDIPSDVTVVGIPGRVVIKNNESTKASGDGYLVDIEAEAIKALSKRLYEMESILTQLMNAQNNPETHRLNGILKNSISKHSPLEEVDCFLDGAGI